jgi:hypothetical protein
MGTVGDAYDNAMAESFFATLECELIARRKWETKTQARLEIFTWIETWYNPRGATPAWVRCRPSTLKNCNRRKNKPQETPKKTQNPEAPTPHPENGLTTGCFAPVDKTTHVPLRGTSSCPQASPVDNPAMVIINEDPEKPRA